MEYVVIFLIFPDNKYVWRNICANNMQWETKVVINVSMKENLPLAPVIHYEVQDKT